MNLSFKVKSKEIEKSWGNLEFGNFQRTVNIWWHLKKNNKLYYFYLHTLTAGKRNVYMWLREIIKTIKSKDDKDLQKSTVSRLEIQESFCYSTNPNAASWDIGKVYISVWVHSKKRTHISDLDSQARTFLSNSWGSQPFVFCSDHNKLRFTLIKKGHLLHLVYYLKC